MPKWQVCCYKSDKREWMVEDVEATQDQISALLSCMASRHLTPQEVIEDMVKPWLGRLLPRSEKR